MKWPVDIQKSVVVSSLLTLHDLMWMLWALEEEVFWDILCKSQIKLVI